MTAGEVRKVVVVGAGQMGRQIALQVALHDVGVALTDASPEALARAMDENRARLEDRVARGRLARAAAAAALARIAPEAELARAAADADLAVEAVVERLEAKRDCFAKLDRVLPEHAVICSASATLMISQIASATGRPDRCANMHWLYPPLVMRLVEVVQGAATSTATAELVAAFARRVDREPLLIRRERPGFVVNRLLWALAHEAYTLAADGVATFDEIDRAAELGLNHPLGPFRLADLAGLDAVHAARLEAYQVTKDPRDLPPPELERRVRRGDLGRKSGRGFYDYSTTPPTPRHG